MQDDLTVGRAVGALPLAETAPPVRQAGVAAGMRDAPGHPNPTVRLDAALGVVVVAFHDAHGVVTTTIPTQQQLDAYRTWERTRSGQPPGSSEV
jgi:hypothetical protein